MMEPEEIIAAALKGTVKYKYDVGPGETLLA